MNVYLLHEAVPFGKPLLPDVSATSDLFIHLLVNPLHCALHWFVLLYNFLDYLRPGLEGQQVPEGTRQLICGHFVSPAELMCVF